MQNGKKGETKRMDLTTERMIDECRPRMEAIIFLKDGTVDRVETPYGKEIPEGYRSHNVQSLVDMYLDWPHKGSARLFVYPDGSFGASIDE